MRLILLLLTQLAFSGCGGSEHCANCGVVESSDGVVDQDPDEDGDGFPDHADIAPVEPPPPPPPPPPAPDPEVDTGKKPESAAQEAIEEAAVVRNNIDALRCFLLHEREAKAGSVPEGWVQPDLDVYEASDDHPCHLLPGFIDPKEHEREVLQQMQAKPSSLALPRKK
jgi:hypothetical protein